MTAKQACKMLKEAGFAFVRGTKGGLLYTAGQVSMVVPRKSDLRARTENDIRRAIHQAQAQAAGK